MARSAKKVETTFCEVTPIGRRRIDPYSGRSVALGETYVIDSNKADFLAGLGEVEILKEDVPAPWAVKETPKPAPAPAPAKPTAKE